MPTTSKSTPRGHVHCKDTYNSKHNRAPLRVNKKCAGNTVGSHALARTDHLYDDDQWFSAWATAAIYCR